MVISGFGASVRHQPSAAIIDLQGEINTLAENMLSAAYDEAASQQPETLLLNFSQVDYINSAGIALVVDLLKRARQAGLPLIAYGLSEHYVEIFQITRLTDFIPLFPDEITALAGKHA